MSRILVVDSDPPTLSRFCTPLVELGHRVFAATDAAEAEAVFREEALDLALVSLHLSSESGVPLLERFKKWDPQVEVILLTDAPSARAAVRAVKLGAFDLLPRTLPAEAVRVAVTSALRTRSLENQIRHLKSELQGLALERVSGKSPPMQRVRSLVEKAARSDVTVLLTGESGVGKEVVAREIVAGGKRAGRPLVTIDCGSLPESLIESELFGHEKGAFTGAVTRRAGRLELGDGGTVFLDEVGNLPLPLQPRLLRVLETFEVQKLGGARPVRVDVRFIAATNADLPALAAAGKFREDLFHRLNVFQIHVPPLRERIEDVALLAEHFLAALNRKHAKGVRSPSPAARALLEAYSWPGNVRELRNVIERAVILAEEAIEPEHLGGIGLAAGTGGGADASVPGIVVPLRQAKERASREVAQVMVTRALERSRGDKRKAARLLGVSLKTLYNHLQAGIGPGPDD